MMKRVLVVLAMVPMFAQAADLSVGTVEISGSSNLGFASMKTEQKDVPGSVDNTDIALGATGLYYVIPNLGVGLSLNYLNTSQKVADVESGISTLVIGPAVGYDYPVQPNVSLFARAAVGYASQTQTETGSADRKLSGYGAQVGVGAKYFLVKQFSIDGGVGYNYAKLTGDEVGGVKPEYTTSGLAVNVGLSVYFGK